MEHRETYTAIMDLIRIGVSTARIVDKLGLYSETDFNLIRGIEIKYRMRKQGELF
jgi:DNA-binding CsgD family transcriptional regulator